MGMYQQPVGIVVSLAPHVVMPLAGGRRVINLPIYLLERIPWAMASPAS